MNLKTKFGKKLQRDKIDEKNLIKHTLPANKRTIAEGKGPLPTMDEQANKMYYSKKGKHE